MQKDPYIVLGLAKGASEEDIKKQYTLLKEKYSSECFLEGEAGAEAARKLSELDVAYKDCMEDIRVASIGSPFERVENAIKAKKYDDAQIILDDIDIRDAEWHYYQSMVYFKKGWYNESKAQIEISIALDPHNDKYTGVRTKMEEYMKNQPPYKQDATSNGGASQQSQQTQQTRAGYSDRQTGMETNANACCDTCCTMMCCDSCCECMGGDLIPCC